MVTATSLKAYTSKDLAQMAKKKGVNGWHSMKKDQLIKALLKVAKSKESSRKTVKKKTSTASKSAAESAVAKKIRLERQREENQKNLALAIAMSKPTAVPQNDRVVLVVRDSFWLQAYWEITAAAVQRAKVALNGVWHKAKPIIRVLEISSDRNTNSVEKAVEEIEIHGGVSNWYFQTKQPGKSYRIAIGYLVEDEKFHLICKSNQVRPSPSKRSEFDEHWTDITNNAEKYYALSGGRDSSSVSCDLQAVFEEKLERPMNPPAFERLGSGVGVPEELSFKVDAHMVVYGSTDPKAHVTVGGEPVRLQNDGSFMLRLDMPDRRQVLPVVASSRDGTRQRTTVLAIERNTKEMESLFTEPS